MTTIDNSSPAFPGQWLDFQPLTGEQVVREQWEGMSLRQYAAIHLRVPDSGVDWMDEMIRKSQRDYFAAKAMHAIIAEPVLDGAQSFLVVFRRLLGLKAEGLDACAQVAYAMADAMLRAREMNND